MKQTSIEWLIEQLRQLAHNDKHHLGMGDIRITQGMLDDFYEQAKEMHYQETKKVCEFWHGKYIPKPIFDEYYQETFKKD